jgi:hypothetical protein
MDEIIKFQIRENGCVEIFPITREQLLWPWEIGHLAESHCALGLELASALKECIRLKYSLNIENEAILRSLGPEYHSIGNPWKTSGLARYAGYIQNKKMASMILGLPRDLSNCESGLLLGRMFTLR